jgi:hypothetical protein
LEIDLPLWRPIRPISTATAEAAAAGFIGDGEWSGSDGSGGAWSAAAKSEIQGKAAMAERERGKEEHAEISRRQPPEGIYVALGLARRHHRARPIFFRLLTRLRSLIRVPNQTQHHKQQLFYYFRLFIGSLEILLRSVWMYVIRRGILNWKRQPRILAFGLVIEL